MHVYTQSLLKQTCPLLLNWVKIGVASHQGCLKEEPDATNFPGKRYKASLTRHSLIVTQVGWLALSVSVCLSLCPLQNPKPRDTQRARSGGRGTRHTESECPAQGPSISWCVAILLPWSSSSRGSVCLTAPQGR